MKETIKKSFIGGLVFLGTVIIGGLAYATLHNSVNPGEALTASMWNNMNNYSTDEINTGKKWIDGKDIFRKVVSFSDTSVIAGGSDIIKRGDAINNLNEVIDIDYKMKINGYWFTDSSNYSIYQWNGSSNLGSSIDARVDSENKPWIRFRRETGTNYSATNISITIEYTKN